jgi:Xaa-Pro aminopeptidase
MRSIKSKLERFFDNSEVDALVLVNTTVPDPNFIYFTCFASGLCENNFLVVKRNGVKLFTTMLEYDTVMAQRPREMTVMLTNTRQELIEKLRNELKGKTVGLNYGFLPMAHYDFLKKDVKILKAVDATASLGATRAIKDGDEINTMSACASMVRYALSNIMRFAKEGMTEKQLAAIFNDIMIKRGAQAPAFKTIVSFGKNSAFPHHFPDGTKLKKNDIVLIDAGAKYLNYRSDMTRTFIFKPDKKSAYYKRVADMIVVVRQAQSNAMALMKEGAVGRDVHLSAEKTINEANGGIYRGKFIHSISHSIGIETHDGDVLNHNSKLVLKRGMVFSCEPGIYVPGFGGVRIEDDVLITEKGNQVL